MTELEYSIMTRDPRVLEMIRAQLDEFEVLTGIRVHLRVMTWETGRAELTRTALYHHGPDLSEIGTTWVGDLMAMNALRPFTSAEVRSIAPPDDFLPAAWQTCHLAGSEDTLAIPWHAETFMLHYRRDLLAKAGVDEAAAFKTHTSFIQAVESLCRIGVPVPFEFPFGTPAGNFLILHYLGSWLWAAGTDICTPDGKRTLFAEPAGMQAIRQYLGLLRTISPQGFQYLLSHENMSPFLNGNSAMFMQQPSFYRMAPDLPAEITDNWGITDLPEAHFLGGSNLVIWKHTHDDRACLELVRYMTRPENMLAMPPQFTGSPPRLSVLNSNAYKSNPMRRLMAQSLLGGRSFPSVPLLGLIESRLVAALTQIVISYASDPSKDPEEMAVRTLESLARKLDVTLSQ